MSKIGRRGFLALMATAMAAAGVEVDADKLLWVPGEKKLFLPPINGWKRSDFKESLKAQRALNQLNSAILERPDRLPMIDSATAMAQIALRAFEERMKVYGGLVGMIGDPRDGMGWRPGDRLQVRINANFAKIHNRPDKVDIHYQVVTAPVERIGQFMESTGRGLQQYEIEMAGRALADHAHRLGLTMFVQPTLPVGADESSRASSLKSSMRVMKQYDVAQNTMRYYFDMLGAKV